MDGTSGTRLLPGSALTLIAGVALAGTLALPAVLEAQLCPCPEPPVYESELHTFQVVTVAEGFQDPWSIAFLPAGEILVTEKPGRLRIVRDRVVAPDTIPGTPEVRFQGQGGLLEVALHPDFARNRLLYLSYSKPNEDGTEGTTAVARARFDGERLTDLEEIFIAEAWSASGAHYAGKLAFDRDGYLFITVGDRGASPLAGPRTEHPAQDLTNHQGTVIRLHDDGRVPADNPFVGRPDALPEIWSYGHRNPQGLVIDHETGDIWSTEHGPQGGDELNLILPGRNYGWPVIGYGVQYGGAPIHEGTHREGMEQPVQFWTPSIATSGLMLYTGDRFPEWRGQLFAGGLDGRQIARVPIVEGEDGGYQVGRLERPGLLLGFGRIRDIRQGLDGLIYIAIDERGGGLTPVVRLEPVAAEVSGEDASASARAPGAASTEELEALYRARTAESRGRFSEADVGFMTGMIAHHQQALEIASLAPTNDAGPAVRRLAERIVNAQVDEIAIMRDWLRERGELVPEVEADGAAGAHHGGAHAERTLGMLTPGQMEGLRRARGSEFDRLFLLSMIQHHDGAVRMARDLFRTDGAAQDPTVSTLASEILADQTTEIALMARLLSEIPRSRTP